MNKTTQIIIAVIVVIIILVGIFYGVSRKPQTPVSKEPIKIGVIAPLSGNMAFMGEGLRDAILLAKEDLEKTKNTKYRYEVIFEDNQLDPALSTNAAYKLINIDKVDVLVTITSGIGNVIAPIAEQNKVVHFAISSDPKAAKGYYNFQHWTPIPEKNRVLVEELKRRNIKKIGAIIVNQEGALAIWSDLKERLKGNNIELVFEEHFNFGDRDFRTLIAKIKNKEAEAYFVLAFNPELSILVKQIREAGIKVPIPAIESYDLIPAEQRKLFEGEWYVSAADPTNEFLDKFTSRYGKEPSIGAPNGYDVFNLVVTAAENVKSVTKPTPTEIARELLKIKNFKGVVGNLDVGEDGIILSKASVKIIKNGKPVTIRRGD